MKNVHFRWTSVAQKRLCLSFLSQLLCWGGAITFMSFDVAPRLKVFCFSPFPPFGKNNGKCARFHWLAVWRYLGRCHSYGCHSYALHSAVALDSNSLSVALLRAHLCWWFLHNAQNADTYTFRPLMYMYFWPVELYSTNLLVTQILLSCVWNFNSNFINKSYVFALNERRILLCMTYLWRI